MSEENNNPSNPTPMIPIVLATLGIAVGLGILLYGQFQRSTKVISAKFEAYQFMTDLQFYLMDDATCTEMLRGSSIEDGAAAKLNYKSGETLVAGSKKGLVTLQNLNFVDVQGGRENYYSAELSYSLNIPGAQNLSEDFIKDRRLKFYYRSSDGKILESCGVKDMLSAE